MRFRTLHYLHQFHWQYVDEHKLQVLYGLATWQRKTTLPVDAATLFLLVVLKIS